MSSTSNPIHVKYGVWLGAYAPIISVTLYHSNAQATFKAYVDSGASYSVFQADVAERLGLHLETGKQIPIYGVDGKRIAVYLHRVGLRIADLNIQATVGFSKELAIGFNILGRHSIFNQLQFCFNDRENELTLSPI